MLNELMNKALEAIVKALYEPLMPIMVFSWIAGIFLRSLVYMTVARQRWFTVELGKRVDRFTSDKSTAPIQSFYIILKMVMERTYYEVFQLRGILMRRRADYVMSLTDRLFLVQKGCALVVKDSLKQIRHLKHGGDHPKMLAISRNVLERNSAFSRVLGIVPAQPVNEILNILPGLFIIAGIFGTFLGIMAALPRLEGINLDDLDQAKTIMNTFLQDVSFSMGTSLMGIILSVSMTLVNAIFSPERTFVEAVNRLENTLDILWNRSSENTIPDDVPAFDEHKDPLIALGLDKQQKQTTAPTTRSKPND